MSISQITKAMLGCAISAGVSFGATAVARVISTDSVDVDGITMPARNFAPVAIGDEVATQGSSAVVQFKDGSDVVLQPKSRVRIEGKTNKLQVRILQGSAHTDLVPASRVQLVDSKGQTITTVITASLPDANTAAALMRPGSPLAPVLFTGASKQPGTILPTNAIAVGQFSGAGTFAAGPGNTATITTPAGLTLNLTLGPNGTYTISSISSTVTLPNGTTTTVTVTSSPLIGASVSGATSSTSSGTSVNIQITEPGSTTPLTPTQASQQVQTSITNTVNQQVQSGQLPTGTQPPSPSPVTTGQFSGSAS